MFGLDGAVGSQPLKETELLWFEVNNKKKEVNNKKEENFNGFHQGAAWKNGAEYLLRPKTLKRDDTCAIRAL